MKKMIIAICCFTLLFSGSIQASGEPQLPKPITVTRNGLIMSVRPELELLTIVQYMGKDNMNIRYGLISRFYTNYKKDIDDHFRKYDNHPAVQYYENAAFSAIDEPPAMILFMRPDFTVDEEAYRSYIKQFDSNDFYFDEIEKLQEFFDLLKDFYLASDFESFFKKHIDYYQTILNNTLAILPEENLLGYMEEFYGQKFDEYNVVLVTLFHTGGFGPSIAKGEQRFIYSLLGPNDVADRIPVFWDCDYFTELEAHEFGHSFIPISGEEHFAEWIEKSEHLLEPISEEMAGLAYSDWDTVLEELILRACVIEMMKYYNPRRAEQLLAEERENGFIYIDTVCKSINKYLAHRAIYKNFNTFIPVIIEDLIVTYPQ
ncbi:DUF4932 domain-containing protein [Lutispora sp.]|uniref:DUF4932 domain-containing protein n=1 Tax=Lutispora sp. TaxID=2828727 RepID=UPI000EEBFCA1|nr:DUF4932 domain-containing protein [Lutispora sp.]MEA4963969.1 DUF4932 domain-containing protein [Lutispora sp.]HCJ58453.1 hypothetical protein [Clostridiaceae bacterium]